MSFTLPKPGKNRKAQIDFPIITFVIVIIALIIFAPIMLKVFTSIKTPMSAAFTNVSATAGANFDKAIDPLITWWDKVMIFAFILSTLLLFISAFLIDTHPIWVILYIMIFFFLIIFSNNIMKAADNIYTNVAQSPYPVTDAQMPFMLFLKDNFFIVILGIGIITGIIMYGKMAWFGGGGNPR